MTRKSFPRTGVYLIADAATRSGVALVTSVTLALSAGVRLVQYRDKFPLGNAQLATAIALREAAHTHDAVFMVNDRVDLACMCGADGVHLGQDDLTIDAARGLLPEGAFVGRSTHDLAEARQAQAEGADYVGFGDVFGTVSKDDTVTPRGTAMLAEVCAGVQIPVYAIGGVTGCNLSRVKLTGAAGAALIGAVLKAPDAGLAAAELVSIWQSA